MSKKKGAGDDSRPTYRDPTPDEQTKLDRATFSLYELLKAESAEAFEETVLSLVFVARRRIIAQFSECQELYRGKLRSTDNYILLARGEPEGLLQYVQSQLRSPFVHNHDLTPELRELSGANKRRLCSIAMEQLLIIALLYMLEEELWYDYGHGAWQIKQSCIDEPRIAGKRLRNKLNAVRGFYDSRTYHGRPSKQARRRDRANGVAYPSTGFSNQVR